MSYSVYMLKSLGKKKITYVGYTKNLKKRLELHNTGKGAKFTRGKSWEIIYKKFFSSKSDAMSFEYKLKKDRRIRMSILQKI